MPTDVKCKNGMRSLVADTDLEVSADEMSEQEAEYIRSLEPLAGPGPGKHDKIISQHLDTSIIQYLQTMNNSSMPSSSPKQCSVTKTRFLFYIVHSTYIGSLVWGVSLVALERKKESLSFIAALDWLHEDTVWEEDSAK